jgi:hypothetical protein
VFAVKENRKSFPPERRIKLGIGWLGLFLLDLFGIRRGAIFFMESSLSSLFLLFLARQFFSPFFALISSSMFWQSTLLSLRGIYIIKKEIIPTNFISSEKFSLNSSRWNVWVKVFSFDPGQKERTHLLNIPNLFGHTVRLFVTLLEFLNALGGVTEEGHILESHQLLPDLLAMTSEDLLHRIG